MKKTLPITLLIISGLQAKEMGPDDLLKSTQNTIQEAPASAPTTAKQTAGDFFRNLADWFDQTETQMGKSFDAMGEQIGAVGDTFDNMWQSTKKRAKKVKKAFSRNTKISVRDNKDNVTLSAQIDDIAPEKDMNIFIESNTFRIELKEGDNELQITGALNKNVLTAQFSARKERKTEDGTIQSTAVQNSVVQQTVMGELDLEALTAEFTKENKTLTITIPKKAAPEKEARKIPVTIK